MSSDCSTIISDLDAHSDAAHSRLKTHTGHEFFVRSAQPADGPDLQTFMSNVSDEDRRFRFLTAMNVVPPHTIKRMTVVDHERTEDFLAYQDGVMIASGMVAADADRTRAEIAISIHRDFKGRGIGWTMLEHCIAWAKSKGIATVESLESCDNHDAIRLQREMGFTAHAVPGDATMMLIEKRLG